jgi:hypothetical protein
MLKSQTPQRRTMEINTDNLHHAYLIESAPLVGERFLSSLFEELEIVRENNPDFHEFSQESFSIDEARILRARAQGKAFGERKIFVIKTNRFTPEAQNALLKTLEEPFPNTHFFIILSARDLLLPTLLSRLQIIRPEEKFEIEGEVGGKEVENFLDLDPAGRIKWVKKFIDNEKPLSQFLDSLLMYLKSEKMDKEIKKVFTVRRFSDDPSMLPRLILEHLSLVLK